jgi:opacity protein-like surface antigen
VLAVLGSLCFARCLIAQTTPYVGVLAGVSTLSADGRSITTGNQSAVSLYKPENGPAVNIFGGLCLTDYFSIQANYVWNRNQLTLTSTQVSESGGVFYEQSRTSSQHAVIGELLVYFRKRQTWIRPYLSVGSGFVYFSSSEQALLALQGTPRLPAQEFDATVPALRVAVGMDFALSAGWALRYSFSETIQRNPISEQLSPPGQRNLANFQNLFGIFKRF